MKFSKLTVALLSVWASVSLQEPVSAKTFPKTAPSSQKVVQSQKLFKQCYAGRGETALNACDRALKMYPDRATTWLNKGTIFARDFQDYSKAISAYDRAIELDPDNSLALANRCRVLGQLGEHEQAVTSCNTALKGDGNWGNASAGWAWETMAFSLNKLERHSEALLAYDRAIAIAPNSASAWNNRGISLAKLGRFKEAITAFEEAAKLTPENSGYHHNIQLAQRQLNSIALQL